ncbi:radical SAM protein [Pedobacter frigoris]|uniref:radical SAM protein n=1 Tax=Pedobacter frigoris TaxID=2571272 RepID=UPI002930E232|nr:radical SAM protein [Pedobacter frigoris]
MSQQKYRYALSLSSQIPHCSLPLRLDTYSKCSFRCSYCFAKNRGGNHPPAGMKVIDTKALDKLLYRSVEDNLAKDTVLLQMLGRRVPLHFGGMSDPFMHYEAIGRKSLTTLSILSKYKYPTVISTKGDLLFDDRYLEMISLGCFAIQLSFSSLDDNVSSLLEFNTPRPSRRIELIKSLSKLSWVSARLQPMIPGDLDRAKDNIKVLAAAGVRHVSVEFLKIPFIDSKNQMATIGKAVGRDLSEYYSQRRTCGLEFLINENYALHWHTELIKVARENKISYSSADTDLLPYDASDSCCSGTAEIEGFGNYYRYTFPQAIRNAIRLGETELKFAHLESEWAPSGSIKHFLNSKTRIEGINDVCRFMADKWNNSNRTIGPLAFQGISDTDRRDENGMKIYIITDSAFGLAKTLGLNNNI